MSEENGKIQPVDQRRLVLPLPDSVGWWWARCKDNPQPGDELCLEVSFVSGDRVIVHYGRDHEYIKPEDSFSSAWFDGMDWIKAESPWQNAGDVARGANGSPSPADEKH
jgi:hypothetical protein